MAHHLTPHHHLSRPAYFVPEDAQLADPSTLMGHLLDASAYARGSADGTGFARLLEAAAQVRHATPSSAAPQPPYRSHCLPPRPPCRPPGPAMRLPLSSPSGVESSQKNRGGARSCGLGRPSLHPRAFYLRLPIPPTLSRAAHPPSRAVQHRVAENAPLAPTPTLTPALALTALQVIQQQMAECKVQRGLAIASQTLASEMAIKCEQLQLRQPPSESYAAHPSHPDPDP